MKMIVKKIGKYSRQPNTSGQSLLSTVVMCLNNLPRSQGWYLLDGALEVVGVKNDEIIKIMSEYDSLVEAVRLDRSEVGRFLGAKIELC